MSFVNIVANLTDIDKVAEICVESGVFHPDDVKKLYSLNSKFTSFKSKNSYDSLLEQIKELLANMNVETQLIDITDFNSDEYKIKSRVDEISESNKTTFTAYEKLKNDYEQCEKNIKQIKHFIGLDISMIKAKSCHYIKLVFGRLPRDSYIKLKAYSDNPLIMFVPCSEDEEFYWGVYVSHISESDEADRIFSSLYFEQIQFEEINSTPEKYLEDLENKKELLKRQLAEAENEIKKYRIKYSEELLKYYTFINKYSCISKIKSYMSVNKDRFIVVGWIPEKDKECFKKMFSCIDEIDIDFTSATEEIKKQPPTKLKNNFLTRCYEFYVDMYGLPGYDEVDPTAFVAITYTLLFGIMFGDLGQGIVLSIAGYLMWKLKKMALGKILIPCGISSAIFGFLYGSVFGFENLLDPFWQSLGLDGKPIHVMESNTINTIVLSAVAIGVILVILAMLLNLYACFKRKDYGSALFGSNGLAGIMFYGSVVFGLIASFIFSKNVFNTVYILGLIILPLLAMLFIEPLSDLISHKTISINWSEYLIQSFFELFETVLSYVSNTMSFLRVGAFILVHAGMMLVVTILAGEPGSLVYVLVQIFGNIFVMVLEGLLVGIQVLRLEYYEMFSRFYTGSGRAYDPVMIKKEI